MNYWLDLFTGQTWDEFRAAGATITGFRPRMKNAHLYVKPGDIFLCYLVRVMHWVGALEVVSPIEDNTQIWKDDNFPVRFKVKPIILLDPEYGIPMNSIKGKVYFFENEKDKPGYKGFLRKSPSKFHDKSDGEFILSLLKNAKSNPTRIDFDKRKLTKRKKYKVSYKDGDDNIITEVSIVEEEQNGYSHDDEMHKDIRKSSTLHTSIQHLLVKLGCDLGLNVWIARNDRNKTHRGQIIGDIHGVINELPIQFSDATQRTIELIDVLWLNNNTYQAAFEIECTTSVYSGLLRMSDLVALQPNINIKLFIVAPKEREEKVQQEITRPTFSLRSKPLNNICGFLSYEKLVDTVGNINALNNKKIFTRIDPDFLADIATYF